MKFSYNWLSEYLSETPAVEDLSKLLTLAGLEVESIDPVAKDVSGVVTGQIIKIEKHQDADKLNICQVDIGVEEPLTIVCGDPSIYEGMKVPVATVGAMLPNDFEIKKIKIRGQVSYGMMCSAEELGIVEKAKGLLDLPKEAPLGVDINEFLCLKDMAIEIDITPNRADCLSLYGVAREVSALTKCDIKPIDFKKTKPKTKAKKEINLVEKQACPNYLSCVIEDIDPATKTPLWMVEKIRRSGIDSVSFVVDITNFVMILTGQPMHAFDLDKISGSISVRNAFANEPITLLDGSKVELSEDTLVIADDEKALAIAGVMGGLDAAIDYNTTNIVLESAYFNTINIAGKARKYGLNTESSHRFERGVDPQLAQKAMMLAVEVLMRFSPEAKAGSIENATAKEFLPIYDPITLTKEKVKKVLGISLKLDYVEAILRSLGMCVKVNNDESLTVISPSYRFDIQITEDLIEEIARVHGYSKLPETRLKVSAKQINISENYKSLLDIKNILVSKGYHEVINYSFIDEKVAKIFCDCEYIKLQNPISAEMSVMRQSLIPSLLQTFMANINRQQTRIRIFESGVCFSDDKMKDENKRFAGCVFGDILQLNWKSNKPIDFYDVKADVVSLFSPQTKLEFIVCDDISWLHPGRSAYIIVNGKKVGVIGYIHPKTLKSLHIKSKAPVVFEIELDALLTRETPAYNKISKFPLVSRDISFLVSKNILVGDIINSLKSLEEVKILKSIEVFDVYQNENEEKKSIAFNFIFQAEKTLEDVDVKVALDLILAKLEKDFDASLRF